MTVSLAKIKDFFRNKTVRLVLVCLFALALLLVCYKVFVPSENAQRGTYSQTAQEAKLADILEKLDGVDDVSIFITEEDGVAVGAVVIFEGTDGLLLRMHLMEITAGALNIAKSAVLVYPAEG